MHCVETWDNKELIVKRLSKYEKRTLWCLFESGTIDIKGLKISIGMLHRSSMSRLIKTLEGKGLVLTLPCIDGGEYRKRITLTPPGNQVAYWIYIGTPMSELMP